MFSTIRFLKKTNFKKSLPNLKISKFFGSASHNQASDNHDNKHNAGQHNDSHGHHGTSNGHHGDNHGDHHGGYGDHDQHHHEITGKVDLKRVYIPLNKQVKTF
jgi:hypothetical protein